MKRSLTAAVVLGGAAWVLISTAGCGPRQQSGPGNDPVIPAARVHARTIESKVRTVTEEVLGTVRAKWHATLEAKLSGRIDSMPVALGDVVQKGQLLAQLDAGEMGARLEQAVAAQEQAASEWKRISSLFEEHGVTRAEYEAAQAHDRVTRATVDEAKAMMSYAQVIAPFDGVVTRKWADVGDLAAPGKPLMDIEDPSVLQVEADVSEAMASRIHRGSQLGIRVDAAPGEIAGIVGEISPAADPASRTFRVKLNLPPTAGLMPGQFARVAVPIGESQSIRVPVSALARRGQLEIVFCVADHHARMHLVKSGKRVGDEIEVLSGIAAGDSVVVSGADQLVDGQLLEVE